MSDKIESFVDPKAIEDIRLLTSSLVEAQRAFIPLMTEIRETSKTMGTSSKDVRQMIEAFEKYSRIMQQGGEETKKYNDLQRQKEALEKKLATTTSENIRVVEKLKEAVAAKTAKVREEIHAEAASTASTDNATRTRIGAREQIRRLTQEIKRQIDVVRGTITENGKEVMTYRAKSARLAQLREQYKDVSEAAGKKLLPEIKKLDAELKKADARMGVHTRQVGNYGRMLTSLVPGLSRFNTGFGVLGAGVMVAVGAFNMLKNAAVAGLNTIKEFEQANANLASILMTSSRETYVLQEQALLLGRTTEYTASQVTLAQTELAKLGFGTQTILNMTPALLGFATSLGASLPSAAQVAGQTLRAFNLSSYDTEKVLTMMTSAANKSAMDFAFLERSVAIVGASASVAKVPLKDTLALLGVLSNSGLDASRAATALRNIFLYLADDTKKLGKAVKGTEMNAESISKAFAQLRKDGVDLADMFQLTDKRAVNALAVLIQNSEQVIELRNNISDLTGTLDILRNTRLDTLTGDITLMKSAWDAFWLSFRENTPIIRDTIKWITEQLTKLAAANEKQGQRREGSAAYGTDFVNQSEIDAFMKRAQERLNVASDAYRKALKVGVDEADAAFKNLLNVQASLKKEAADRFKLSFNEFKQFEKELGYLRSTAKNDREKKLASELEATYNTLGTTYTRLNTQRSIAGGAQQRIDSGKLTESQIAKEQITIRNANLKIAELETYATKLLAKTGDIYRKATGESDSFGRQVNRIFTLSLNERKKFEGAAYGTQVKARKTYGNMLTDERIVQGVEDLIAESQRTNIEESVGKNYTPPTNGKRTKADIERERQLAREQAMRDAEALAAFNIKISDLKDIAAHLRAISEQDSVEWDSRRDSVEGYIDVLQDVARLEMERKNQDLIQRTMKENDKLTGKVVDPNVIDPVTGKAQTDVEKATLNQRIFNYKEFLRTKNDLDVQRMEDIKKIDDKQDKYNEEQIKKNLETFKEGLKQRQEDVETERKKEIESLNKLYRKGSLTDTGLRDETAKTNVIFDEKVVEQTRAYYKQWIDKLDLPQALKDELEKQFDTFNKQDAPQMLAESSADYEKQTGKNVSTIRKGGTWLRRLFGTGVERDSEGKVDVGKSTNKVAEFGKSASNFLNTEEVKLTEKLFGDMTNVIVGFYDVEIAKIDEVMEKERERYEEQQKLLDDSLTHLQNNLSAGLLSEQTFNAQKRQIELQKESEAKKQEALEKKREAEKRKLQEQQAKWAKANSYVQAVMNTAQGVASALTIQPAPLGIAFATAVGAIGAAQIALIAAQEIPKYAKGTDDHAGGLMVVGDGGVPEYVVTPDNKVSVTPNKSTLMDAPAHTKVFKDDKDFLNYLFEKNKYVDTSGGSIVNEINVDTDYIEQRKLLRSIDRRLGAASENEKYRLRLIRHNKLFDTW